MFYDNSRMVFRINFQCMCKKKKERKKLIVGGKPYLIG